MQPIWSLNLQKVIMIHLFDQPKHVRKSSVCDPFSPNKEWKALLNAASLEFESTESNYDTFV